MAPPPPPPPGEGLTFTYGADSYGSQGYIGGTTSGLSVTFDTHNNTGSNYFGYVEVTINGTPYAVAAAPTTANVPGGTARPFRTDDDQVLNLDGSGDYVYGSWGAGWTGNLTAEAWIKPDTVSTNQVLF